MDKMEQRNKRKNRLIYYIVISISLTLIIVNTYFIKINIKLKDNIESNQEKIKYNENQYNSIINEFNQLQKELTQLQNIDTEIEEIRKEYYQNLKLFEDKVINKETNYKIAYITFDDGPYDLTHKYLEILEKYNIRATFFTIGLNKEKCYDNKSKSCQELYAKIAKYGHTMANHTYSHLIFNGLYSSSDSFINNVKKQEDLIKNNTGLTTNIVRFPGGINSSGYLKNDITNKLKELGYGWVEWTASDGDGGYIKDKNTALNNLKNTINEDIEVILFHDYSYITLSILPEAIEYLQSKNYVLLPLFYQSKMVNK